ncbi:hypothetical protein TYRP_017030 [Tyrophagus putrescentiae]|nr:hypothetical protein TYRP_017030 [Tyrophagus putrescentiae]
MGFKCRTSFSEVADEVITALKPRNSSGTLRSSPEIHRAKVEVEVIRTAAAGRCSSNGKIGGTFKCAVGIVGHHLVSSEEGLGEGALRAVAEDVPRRVEVPGNAGQLRGLGRSQGGVDEGHYLYQGRHLVHLVVDVQVDLIGAQQANRLQPFHQADGKVLIGKGLKSKRPSADANGGRWMEGSGFLCWLPFIGNHPQNVRRTSLYGSAGGRFRGLQRNGHRMWRPPGGAQQSDERPLWTAPLVEVGVEEVQLEEFILFNFTGSVQEAVAADYYVHCLPVEVAVLKIEDGRQLDGWTVAVFAFAFVVICPVHSGAVATSCNAENEAAHFNNHQQQQQQNAVTFYDSYHSLMGEIATSLLDLVTSVFIDLGSITAELVRPLRDAITTFITDMGAIAMGTLNELMAIAVGSTPPPSPPYPPPPMHQQTPEKSIAQLQNILTIYDQTSIRLLDGNHHQHRAGDMNKSAHA